LIPVFAAAGTIASVGRTAFKVADEIRRQFRDIPGLLEGREGIKPDPRACVSLAAGSSIKEMIVPLLAVLLSPIAVGVLFGTEVLGGMILGAAVTGIFLSISMSNAGGAWNNAKKYIEAGNFGGKGTGISRAAAVGDMAGDPLRDTAGPAMHTVIKATAIVSLVIAPFLKPGGLLSCF
jgi:K(+)-stimulated pyrophosphate-energized sodium pump